MKPPSQVPKISAFQRISKVHSYEWMILNFVFLASVLWTFSPLALVSEWCTTSFWCLRRVFAPTVFSFGFKKPAVYIHFYGFSFANCEAFRQLRGSCGRHRSASLARLVPNMTFLVDVGRKSCAWFAKLQDRTLSLSFSCLLLSWSSRLETQVCVCAYTIPADRSQLQIPSCRSCSTGASWLVGTSRSNCFLAVAVKTIPSSWPRFGEVPSDHETSSGWAVLEIPTSSGW